ncbi:hypothetical protein H5410_046684 [Solanum commersonii]|uniref:Uncharacterized protein n=1 Tax=Solanum commersonii TaxID=4109 RepID=A0A9J5XEZ9_SOLCO|nr:hypothetical protein H5410_046684 [Solanum commersonii]
MKILIKNIHGLSKYVHIPQNSRYQLGFTNGLEKVDKFFEGMDMMYFFMEVSIPWIMRWTVEVDNTEKVQKDLEGKCHDQETIDMIITSIDTYRITTSQPKVDIHNPFKQIDRRLQMNKGTHFKNDIIASHIEEISATIYPWHKQATPLKKASDENRNTHFKNEIIVSYIEEVKKDLLRNLDIYICDDVSMESTGHITEGEESYIAGEAQTADSNEEIDIDSLLQQIQNQVEESSSKTACKDKGKCKI